MAARYRYEAGNYQSPNFTAEKLMKFKYGIACVSNVDGRGNVSIYAMIRRQRKNNSKPIFDYANILGHVGGEIRDGFCNENLKEGEATRFMQTHVELAKGRSIRMTFVPVEEVAALFVLPLHKKSVEKGYGFPDSSTEKAFEHFKQVAEYCSYASVEDFFDAKLGKSPRTPDRSKFEGYRAELESWWLEKAELMYHDCPLPPPPPPISLVSGISESFPGFMHQAKELAHNYELSESWKKTAASKFSNPLSYERFSGMAKQQALWYIWMGDADRAVVMIDCWKALEKDSKKGKALDLKITVIDLILTSTHANLSTVGLFTGGASADARLTPKEKCDTCLSPACKAKAQNNVNLLTCVDKVGNGEFGFLEMRKNVAKLLFAVYKFGINSDFKTSASHCFKEALHIFLEHSFTVLFWRIKPTNPMTAATENDAVPGFIEALTKPKGELDVNQFSNSCKAVLKEALVKNCGSKLGEVDIKKLCELFSSKLNKVVVLFNKLAKEEATARPAEGPSEKEVSMDLLSKTVVPTMIHQFKCKWSLISTAKRRKLLTADSMILITCCSGAYKKVDDFVSREQANDCDKEGVSGKSCSQTESTSQRVQISVDGKPFPDKCTDDSCACKNVEKLPKYLIDVLSSDNNPITYFKCLPNGDLMLDEELCHDKEGDFFERMISYDDEYIFNEIRPIDDERFASCPRLALLCKMSCHRIFPLLLTSLIQDFGELEKKDNARSEHHACQCCGMLESQPGEFKRCGGCKSVYYCGRKCQARDWKAGHKQKCQTAKGE